MGEDDDNYYRLRVVRRAPVGTPADLEGPLEGLVRALARADPARFELSGLSPAEHTTRVLQHRRSLVPAFLSTSAIEWNFGREPADPTHEIIFFNDQSGERTVVLRLSFVADGAISTAPGLAAELVLGRDAAGPTDGRRGGHLDELFSMLLTALRPDYGHVELPGYPQESGWPKVCAFGWITYFSRTEGPSLPELRPPAMAVRAEAGTKLFATPGLALEQHADVATAIDSVREQVTSAAHPPSPPHP